MLLMGVLGMVVRVVGLTIVTVAFKALLEIGTIVATVLVELVMRAAFWTTSDEELVGTDKTLT